MVDRRGFFGWLAGFASFGTVKEVQAVQTSQEARPLFVLTLDGTFPMVEVERLQKEWEAKFPEYDLAILPEGSRLEAHLSGQNQLRTTEAISDNYELEISAPDLATYERLRELCVPKPMVVEYYLPTEVSKEEMARIREEWERNQVFPVSKNEMRSRMVQFDEEGNPL